MSTKYYYKVLMNGRISDTCPKTKEQLDKMHFTESDKYSRIACNDEELRAYRLNRDKLKSIERGEKKE